MAKRKVVTSGSSRKSKETGADEPSSKSDPLQGGQQRSLTSDEIGQVAGEVWQLLTGENNQSLTSIKKSIDAPDVLILAAIGWLAREDKLHFNTSGRFTNISLR